MTIEEVKDLIILAQSIKREAKRIKEEIDVRRDELSSVKSVLGGSVAVISSVRDSMPERVYFRLEKLYDQYSETLQQQYDKTAEIESAIAALDPVEQEIVRAWIEGKTEEQIGAQVGYSRPTISRYKRRILIKMKNMIHHDT